MKRLLNQQLDKILLLLLILGSWILILILISWGATNELLIWATGIASMFGGALVGIIRGTRGGTISGETSTPANGMQDLKPKL